MQKSLDFYTKTIGFRTINTLTRPDSEIVRVSVGFDSPLIILSPVKKLQAPRTREESASTRPGITVEFHICVDGWKKLDEFFAELEAKGASVIHELETDVWGGRSFTITDPDGYTLSFGGRAENVTSRKRSFVMAGQSKRLTQRRSYDSIFNTH